LLYNAYEFQQAWLSGVSSLAASGATLLRHSANPWKYGILGPQAANALEVFAHATANYEKPEFGITEVTIENQHYAVEETTCLKKPFGNLKRFRHEGLKADVLPLLIIAPMSGHYATLLRGTVERMLESCEVYITDWADAKTVPLSEGNFDLDNYIDYTIEFLDHIHKLKGRPVHVMAVCQPSVPAFIATAILNARNAPSAPRSLTMMGGPIDTRLNPTAVNKIAIERPIEWFRQSVIAQVPKGHPGAGRRVYPGFLQLTGFMSMNLASHIMSHYEMFKDLGGGNFERVQATKSFYEEYRSVSDMTAEFYLQTVEKVFQKHALPKGEFLYRDQNIDPAWITKTALLAIEGGRDDISGLGQTAAALELATLLPESKKSYHIAEEVGHYGIFNGSKWRHEIAPRVERFMGANP
jgi:poly(3-hydroxybutyrate) depolymerase